MADTNQQLSELISKLTSLKSSLGDSEKGINNINKALSTLSGENAAKSYKDLTAAIAELTRAQTALESKFGQITTPGLETLKNDLKTIRAQIDGINAQKISPVAEPISYGAKRTLPGGQKIETSLTGSQLDTKVREHEEMVASATKAAMKEVNQITSQQVAAEKARLKSIDEQQRDELKEYIKQRKADIELTKAKEATSAKAVEIKDFLKTSMN